MDFLNTIIGQFRQNNSTTTLGSLSSHWNSRRPLDFISVAFWMLGKSESFLVVVFISYFSCLTMTHSTRTHKHIFRSRCAFPSSCAYIPSSISFIHCLENWFLLSRHIYKQNLRIFKTFINKFHTWNTCKLHLFRSSLKYLFNKIISSCIFFHLHDVILFL